MSTKPTVGRIVHFFDKSLSELANNSMGAGPYAAIVGQVFDSPNNMANLKVLLPFGKDKWEGSVPMLATEPTDQGRYWSWPARD